MTTWYGRTRNSRIVDPDQPAHVFGWSICDSYDDRGNAASYEYKEEDSDGVDLATAHERHRTPAGRSVNRYPKRIRYGNRRPHLPDGDPLAPLPGEWLFEVVFDYGEHDATPERSDAETSTWPARPDPFSTYRAGFEVRTYRLCRRVLMFHHFQDELDAPDVLVRSTDFSYAPDGDLADRGCERCSRRCARSSTPAT